MNILVHDMINLLISEKLYVLISNFEAPLAKKR